jgi:hypothetical protein
MANLLLQGLSLPKNSRSGRSEIPKSGQMRNASQGKTKKIPLTGNGLTQLQKEGRRHEQPIQGAGFIQVFKSHIHITKSCATHQDGSRAIE